MFKINDLPLEILLEILYGLSVKELHRNKIVCKLWSSLISHPSFGSEYSVRRNSSSPLPIRPSLTLYLTFLDLTGFFYTQHLTYDGESMLWSKNSQRFSMNFLPKIQGSEPHQTHFLGSSNGLLLCCKTYFFSGCVYCVCNPVTKQWFTLPSPPSNRSVFEWGIVSYPSYEFAKGSTQTQFKVVTNLVKKISTPYNSMVLTMVIFESATNQWRVLTTSVDVKFTWFDKTCPVKEHRGILYWMSELNHWLIAFDPDLDLCHPIALPGTHCDSGYSVFGASRDHLYYALLEYSRLRTNVWRYEDLEGERTWSLHRRFDLDWIDQHIFSYFLIGWDCRILAIDPMDCNILYVSLCHIIFSLDLVRKEMKELYSFPHDRIGDLMLVHPTWPTSIPRS